ncbi:Uncharacterized protein FKW44_018862, partial [Caligus rogercresseyi]
GETSLQLKQIDLAKEMEAIKKFSFLDEVEENGTSSCSPSITEPTWKLTLSWQSWSRTIQPPTSRDKPHHPTQSFFFRHRLWIPIAKLLGKWRVLHKSNYPNIGIDKIKLLNGDGIKSYTKTTEGAVESLGKAHALSMSPDTPTTPFQHSPNDCPEAELLVNAGDYILVWGDVDEDGFFDGELLDGRRGLVPSNFVEKLEGEDLIDFHSQVILGLGDCDDSVCTSVPQDLDFISSSDDNEERAPYSRGAVSLNASTPYPNTLHDDEEFEDGARSKNALPPPQQLTVEMQLNKSFLVAWNAPGTGEDEDDNKKHKKLSGEIASYSVIVDGSLHSSVVATGSDMCLKALSLHRISVKSVAAKDGSGKKPSQEAACTMVIGKDAPLGPTGLKSSKITSTSCNITWIPSNTNFLHSICSSGCLPTRPRWAFSQHKYKVTIRAKNIRQAAPAQILSCDNLLDNLSSQIEIRTLPEGLPDPPLDVRVDEAPEHPEQWCISWLPVTINPSGTSNGALVVGYVVYCDDKHLQDVDSGTADHVCVPKRRPAAFITVRTKLLSPLEDEATKMRELTLNYNGFSHDMDSDIGPSELSDIAEEPEEEERKKMHWVSSPDDGKKNLFPPRFSRLPTRDTSRQTLSNLSSSQSQSYPQQENKSSGLNNHNSTPLSITTKIPPSRDKNHPKTLHDVPEPGRLRGRTSIPGRWLLLGESNGCSGYVPCNMVSEVQVDDERVAEELFRDQSGQEDRINSTNNNKAREDRWGDIYEDSNFKRKLALYDYDPAELSPNVDSEVELSFRTGDIIEVFGEMDDDGFYLGEFGGKRGLVPSNFLTDVPQGYEPKKVFDKLAQRKASPTQLWWESWTLSAAATKDSWAAASMVIFTTESSTRAHTPV